MPDHALLTPPTTPRRHAGPAGPVCPGAPDRHRYRHRDLDRDRDRDLWQHPVYDFDSPHTPPPGLEPDSQRPDAVA